MNIALVSRTDEREPHCAKLLNSLVNHGYRCTLIGWNCFPEPWQPSSPRWFREVWHKPSDPGLGAAKFFFGFRKFVARALARHSSRLVIAVNEEVLYMIENWRGRLFSSLLLDARDELDLRVHRPNPALRMVLRHVAHQAREAADGILCAQPRRRELYRTQHQEKTVILANYPADFGADCWYRFPRGEFRIFAGGALGRGRGLEFLLQAAKAASVRIVSAGRLTDDYSRNIFGRDPLVDYLGCLTPDEAMRTLADCHVSVAFYAPGPKINGLAAPSKVYDGLCAGRPILVSAGSEIADWVEQNELGYRIRYGDVEGLIARIEQLKARQPELPRFARRARELFVKGYSWESQEPVLFSAIDTALNRTTMASEGVPAVERSV